MDKKGEKRIFYILACFIFIGILLVSFTSAGFADWFKKTLTGKATTATFTINVTVGTPQIIGVWNGTTTNFIAEAPAKSSVTINFTIYCPGGAANVNDSTAKINITRTGETTRFNNSCVRLINTSNLVNFTCNITMYFWDGNGSWNIGAYIEDNNSNSAINITKTFDVGGVPALVSGPSGLTWPGIASGSKNQTSNNDPLEINNTGNVVMANLTINSTDLLGETTSTLGLWASNFTVNWNNGSSPPAECNGTAMSDAPFETYTLLAVANLTKGNYTVNDGKTGQEELYFCLKYAGTELTTQAYSTNKNGSWIVKGTV